MECHCERDTPEDAVTASWMNSSSKMQMGAFTVVGYLLYRFSQTLPALIRWPVRLFCSLTGLSTLWSWVSRLVGTIRGIQSLFKWLSQLWRFITAFSSRFKWLVNIIKVVTGSSDGELESEVHSANSSSSPNKPDLRLILLGPSNGGRTSLAATLLGNSETRATMGPLMESTKQKAVVEGREITVIDTPDLLGHSLGSNSRAKEALRCLQLTSPGPHAFLLVFQAPGSSMGTDHNASQALQATLKLFGDGVIEYIIPVLTHADHLGKRCTVDQLLDVDSGGLRRVVSLCCQKPELVDNRADRPPETQSVMRRQLLGRVTELKKLRGHFIHELQSREDRMREELLADMSSALARKVGHM